MAGTPITFTAVGQRFGCGDDFTNLQVINFTGPGGGKVSAYSCNMNVDMDGDPQTYAPVGKAGFKPLDYLGNAGWLSKAKNDATKTKYEAKKKELADLEAKHKAATAAAPVGAPAAASSSAPGGAKPAAPADLKALDQQIALVRKELLKLNPYKSTAKNYEKIFWSWYGVVALTPEEAKRDVYAEQIGTSGATQRRSPKLDTGAEYEDVYGKFPVVQSEFEPGPGYYVSALPRVTNPKFKNWDQRAFLPPDADAQRPYGALSTVLAGATGLALKDRILAVRLDDGTTGQFPFLDTGFKPKVAECSVHAFVGMGGTSKQVHGLALPVYQNNFLLLYLTFPGGKAPADVLAAYAAAPNADEFPLVLSFLAQRTVDGKRGHISGDPLTNYLLWKKQKPELRRTPAVFDTISDALEGEGFKAPATAATLAPATR